MITMSCTKYNINTILKNKQLLNDIKIYATNHTYISSNSVYNHTLYLKTNKRTGFTKDYKDQARYNKRILGYFLNIIYNKGGLIPYNNTKKVMYKKTILFNNTMNKLMNNLEGELKND